MERLQRGLASILEHAILHLFRIGGEGTLGYLPNWVIVCSPHNEKMYIRSHQIYFTLGTAFFDSQG